MFKPAALSIPADAEFAASPAVVAAIAGEVAVANFAVVVARKMTYYFHRHW